MIVESMVPSTATTSSPNSRMQSTQPPNQPKTTSCPKSTPSITDDPSLVVTVVHPTPSSQTVSSVAAPPTHTTVSAPTAVADSLLPPPSVASCSNVKTNNTPTVDSGTVGGPGGVGSAATIRVLTPSEIMRTLPAMGSDGISSNSGGCQQRSLPMPVSMTPASSQMYHHVHQQSQQLQHPQMLKPSIPPSAPVVHHHQHHPSNQHHHPQHLAHSHIHHHQHHQQNPQLHQHPLTSVLCGPNLLTQAGHTTGVVMVRRAAVVVNDFFGLEIFCLSDWLLFVMIFFSFLSSARSERQIT